jgi:hypothetical protein
VFQTVPLAGLSAVGFAFTENILYYIRQFIYSTKFYGVDPTEQLNSLALQRGIYTSWGHPLFTSMLALGVIFGLRQRSKIVRIISPLAGYCMAAFGHMLFNGFASTVADVGTMLIFGAMFIFSLLMFFWRQNTKERQQIAWRLDDYVRMGWLLPRDPLVFSVLANRLKLWVAGLLRGWTTWRATCKLMSDITELAYLRTQMTRGTVEAIGAERERELLIEIRALRGIALDEVRDLPIRPDWQPKARIKKWWHDRVPGRTRKAPAFAPPTGAPVGFPAPTGIPVGAYR